MCGSGYVYVQIYQMSVPVCKYESPCIHVKYGESSPHKGFTFICSTLGETTIAHPKGYICIDVKKEGRGKLAGHLVCLINESELLPWVLWYKWWWWEGCSNNAHVRRGD